LFIIISNFLGIHCADSRVQEERPPTVEIAANLFQKLVYENKNGLMAGIIIGGWDPLHGPSVYSIPLGGSLHKRPFAIGGSGSSYIYGYCDANYREGMTREECIQFTKNGNF
jgi:20S proteasome subunit beta 1